MKQAIPGVAPAEIEECAVTTVWPSVASFTLGRVLGRLFSLRTPDIAFLRLGNLCALLLSPLGALLYLLRLSPRVAVLAQWPCTEDEIDDDKYVTISAVNGSSYQLTNRRVMEVRTDLLLRIGIGPADFGASVAVVFAAIVISLLFAWPVMQIWNGIALDPISFVKSGAAVFLVVLAIGIVSLVAQVRPFAAFVPVKEVKSKGLGTFDSIDIEVQPGQAWFYAGDLVFRDGGTETFRLAAVSRPEAFRATCMKSQQAYVGVNKALGRELAPA